MFVGCLMNEWVVYLGSGFVTNGIYGQIVTPWKRSNKCRYLKVIQSKIWRLAAQCYNRYAVGNIWSKYGTLRMKRRQTSINRESTWFYMLHEELTIITRGAYFKLMCNFITFYEGSNKRCTCVFVRMCTHPWVWEKEIYLCIWKCWINTT